MPTNPYYQHNDGAPATLTRGQSSVMRAEFDLLQAGFDAVSVQAAGKGNIAGQVWTGVQDFSGATEVLVPAPVNASDAATKGYADTLSFSAALPGAPVGIWSVPITNGGAISWSPLPAFAIFSYQNFGGF